MYYFSCQTVKHKVGWMPKLLGKPNKLEKAQTYLRDPEYIQPLTYTRQILYSLFDDQTILLSCKEILKFKKKRSGYLGLFNHKICLKSSPGFELRAFSKTCSFCIVVSCSVSAANCCIILCSKDNEIGFFSR